MLISLTFRNIFCLRTVFYSQEQKLKSSNNWRITLISKIHLVSKTVLSLKVLFFRCRLSQLLRLLWFTIKSVLAQHFSTVSIANTVPHLSTLFLANRYKFVCFMESLGLAQDHFLSRFSSTPNTKGSAEPWVAHLQRIVWIPWIGCTACF